MVYELRIRGITNGKTVEEIRQLLCCALRDEIQIKEGFYLNIAEEIYTCDVKVVNLAADVDNIYGK